MIVDNISSVFAPRHARLVAAAEEHGWNVRLVGKFRGEITRGEFIIEFVRDVYRHTSGRLYRGRRLVRIFYKQSEILEYMATKEANAA